MGGLLKQTGLLKARTLAKAAGGGGAALSFSATPVAAGAASGSAAGQLSCSLLGTVSYSVLSGALAVNSSTGVLTTTSTAAASGTISAKVRAATSTDAVETTISVPIQAAAPTLSTLAFSPSSPSIALSAVAGTTVATIANKTAGSTLSITPNDGRYAVAGDDTNGWRVVVGLSASSAGTDSISVVETLAGATGSPKGTALFVVRTSLGPLTALLTNTALTAQMASQTTTPFAGGVQTAQQIVTNPAQLYQPFLGVGSALTGSSISRLLSLTLAQRTALFTEMFVTNGHSTLRITLASCDFEATNGFVTYDDVANDTSLANFSIQSDVNIGKVQLVKEILAIQPNLFIIAAPWTPPGWTKTSGNQTLIGGTFNGLTANKTFWANYLVKAVQAWAAQGVTINSITAQNEPNYSATYPSCMWGFSDLADFNKNYLAPALTTAGLSTEVWVGDASWGDTSTYVTDSLTGAPSNITAGAYHAYTGTFTKQSADIPYSAGAKAIHQTEMRTLFSQNNDASMALMAGDVVIGSIRNFARSVTLWNMALDETGAPNQNGQTGRRGVVTIQSDGSGTITRSVEYYILSSLGRFVQRGARMIGCTSPAAGSGGTDLEAFAFLNPDNSQVVLIWNAAGSAKSMVVTDGYSGLSTPQTIPSRALEVVYFPPNAAKAALALAGTPSATSTGGPYSFTPTTSGGVPNYTYALTGTLPTGLSFSTTTGAITGTPTTTQTATGLNITVTDALGAMASLGAFSITVTISSSLAISGTPKATANQGSDYSFVPTASGGTAPYTFALTGTLPTGMTFSASTGAITGPATATGTATGLNITVTDNVGATASLGTFSIAVTVTALTQDAVANYVVATAGNTGTNTWSHTLASDANLLVVALALNVPGLSGGGAGSDRPVNTSVTAGGVAMTKLDNAASTGSTSVLNRAAELWYLKNPPTGVVSIVVNTPLGSGTGVQYCNLYAESVSYRFGQSTPFGTQSKTSTTTAGGATSLSTTTTASLGTVLSVSSIRSTTNATLGGPMTAIAQGLAGSNTAGAIAKQAVGSPATSSLTWTTADQGALLAVPILSAA